MEFTDKEVRKRIHNGVEEINEYIGCISKGVSGYVSTHVSAAKKGIPVSLEDVPTNIEEVSDLSARMVYIDQRIIIDNLLEQSTQLKEELKIKYSPRCECTNPSNFSSDGFKITCKKHHISWNVLTEEFTKLKKELKKERERLKLTEGLLISHEAIGTKLMDHETWLRGKNKYLQEYRDKPRDITI